MLAKIIITLALLLSLGFSINLVSPQISNAQNNDFIDVGKIGPGQTISLLIDPKVIEGGIHGIGGQYDQAVAFNLPKGWSTTDSKLYQNPLQVTITTDPNSPPGNYTIPIKIIDENDGEKLGNIILNVKVQITWDVMDFEVTPSSINTGPGQPARFALKITNKGSTSDVFQVSTSGPKRWQFTKPVFIPAQSSKTIYYEIVSNEEETYQSTIKVVSLASNNIADEENVTLSVHSDLFGDYKATNHGVVVFPIFEAPVYSFAGLLSNLFG